MSDLINRQAAIDTLNDEFTVIGKTNAIVVQDYIRRVNNRLHDLPSAQPEIVRCKDCKYWDTTWQNDWAPNYHYCPNVDGTHRGDFYCADAERRTDE